MCIAKLSKSPDASRWKAMPDWGRAHHYCHGHKSLNRARAARSPRDQIRNYKAAADEFSYMILHDTPGAVLTAESYMQRGIARIMMKEESEAAGDLVQAISRDPRLERAYLALADLYANRKQRSEALEVVTNGLRHVPSSEGLKRRYSDLGGQPPFPEPAARKGAETPSKPAAPQPEASAAAASVAPAEAKPATEAREVEASASPAAAAPARARSCRFCAEDLPPAQTGSAPPKADEPTPSAKPRSCRFCAD
jgi:tetratricopeptide (TPR) repeat protein